MDIQKVHVINNLRLLLPHINWDKELADLSIDTIKNNKLIYVDLHRDCHDLQGYRLILDHHGMVLCVIKTHPMLGHEHPVYKSFTNMLSRKPIQLDEYTFEGNLWPSFKTTSINPWNELVSNDWNIDDDSWFLVNYPMSPFQHLVVGFSRDGLYLNDVSAYLIDTNRKILFRVCLCCCDVPRAIAVRQNGDHIEVLLDRNTFSPNEEILYKDEFYEGRTDDEYVIEPHQISDVMRKIHKLDKKHTTSRFGVKVRKIFSSIKYFIFIG